MKKFSFSIRAIAGATALAFCLLSFCGCNTPGLDHIPGDCNGDGAVNAKDSLILLRYLSQKDTNIKKKNADLNSDEAVNDLDHTVLLEYLADISRPGMRFSDIHVNGVSLSDFVIVVPEKANDFEKWTADILASAVYDLCGTKPQIVKDSEKEKIYEILVGSTNRSQSAKFEANEGEYSIHFDLGKLVLTGKDYYVAGGVGYILNLLSESDARWNGHAYINIPTEATSLSVEWKRGEKVFLFIGDGMGSNHTKLATDEDALVLYAQGTAAPPDEKGFECFWPAGFENIGESITLNIQNSTTDSAAGATALSTGCKTLNGAIGMIPADLDGDGEENEFRSVQNVREAAALSGMATAVLSTDKQTGATPNAFLTHHYSRKDRSILLEQQTALDMSPLACTYLWCSYDSDDALNELVDAIDVCDDNKNGFFIMTEEAMIDKYAEKMDYDNVIRTVKRLNRMTAFAATYALCYTDTVIIITADHETGGLTLADDGVWQWTSDGEHTGTNVPVFAMGYGTEIFNENVCDNTAIAKFIFDIVE